MDGRDGGRNGADFLNLRPELAQGPDLGHRQELVLIDAHCKSDMRRSVDQCLSRILEQPQMSDGGRQHRTEFLRLGRAGVVENATVGLQQHARNAEGKKVSKRLRHGSLQGFDRHEQPACSGKDRGRVDPEAKA